MRKGRVKEEGDGKRMAFFFNYFAFVAYFVGFAGFPFRFSTGFGRRESFVVGFMVFLV